MRHKNQESIKVAALKNVCIVEDPPFQGDQEKTFDKYRHFSNQAKASNPPQLLYQDSFAINKDHITYPVAKAWEKSVKE